MFCLCFFSFSKVSSFFLLPSLNELSTLFNQKMNQLIELKTIDYIEFIKNQHCVFKPVRNMFS